MALKGDTVRLEVRFMDFDGISVEPEDVTLNIYNEDNVALESILLTSDNRTDIGEYYYDYVIPYAMNDYIIYEFSGIHRGRPILSRDKIHVDFVWGDYLWLDLDSQITHKRLLEQ